MSSTTRSKLARTAFESDPDPLAEFGCIRFTDAAAKYGISRTELFRLCVPEETAKVKSHLYRQYPDSRGIRLVEVKSLVDYIRSGGATKTPKNEKARTDPFKIACAS
jgi:hypothetical protein